VNKVSAVVESTRIESELRRIRLRDEFAMAALSGLLAHSGWAPDDAALCAYRHADAMMRERERRE
jgi:hypothetical protein